MSSREKRLADALAELLAAYEHCRGVNALVWSVRKRESMRIARERFVQAYRTAEDLSWETLCIPPKETH